MARFRCFVSLFHTRPFSVRWCSTGTDLSVVGPPPTNNAETRVMKIAVIGTPNSGKSTLINALVDRRVFAISRKVHTTRCRARAVLVEENTQLVFLDTPGLVSTSESEKYNLDQKFVSGGEDAIEEADVIGVVHDLSNKYTRYKLDYKVLRLLHLFEGKESFLVLNKIDTMKSRRKLLDISTVLTGGRLRKFNEPPTNEKLSELMVSERIRKESCWKHFSDVFMVSALLGQGTSELRTYLLQGAHPGEWLFDGDTFTDQDPVQIIETTVRSRLLEHLPNEVPYTVGVQLEYLDRDDKGRIVAVVLIECQIPRIEKLVMGNRGAKIRQIAIEAERSLVDTFHSNVFLRLVVQQNKQETVQKPRYFSEESDKYIDKFSDGNQLTFAD